MSSLFRRPWLLRYCQAMVCAIQPIDSMPEIAFGQIRDVDERARKILVSDIHACAWAELSPDCFATFRTQRADISQFIGGIVQLTGFSVKLSSPLLDPKEPGTWSQLTKRDGFAPNGLEIMLDVWSMDFIGADECKLVGAPIDCSRDSEIRQALEQTPLGELQDRIRTRSEIQQQARNRGTSITFSQKGSPEKPEQQKWVPSWDLDALCAIADDGRGINRSRVEIHPSEPGSEPQYQVYSQLPSGSQFNQVGSDESPILSDGLAGNAQDTGQSTQSQEEDSAFVVRGITEFKPIANKHVGVVAPTPPPVAKRVSFAPSRTPLKNETPLPEVSQKELRTDPKLSKFLSRKSDISPAFVPSATSVKATPPPKTAPPSTTPKAVRSTPGSSAKTSSEPANMSAAPSKLATIPEEHAAPEVNGKLNSPEATKENVTPGKPKVSTQLSQNESGTKVTASTVVAGSHDGNVTANNSASQHSSATSQSTGPTAIRTRPVPLSASKESSLGEQRTEGPSLSSNVPAPVGQQLASQTQVEGDLPPMQSDGGGGYDDNVDYPMSSADAGLVPTETESSDGSDDDDSESDRGQNNEAAIKPKTLGALAINGKKRRLGPLTQVNDQVDGDEEEETETTRERNTAETKDVNDATYEEMNEVAHSVVDSLSQVASLWRDQLVQLQSDVAEHSAPVESTTQVAAVTKKRKPKVIGPLTQAPDESQINGVGTEEEEDEVEAPLISSLDLGSVPDMEAGRPSTTSASSKKVSRATFQKDPRVHINSSNVITWLGEGGPGEAAGMEEGDVVVSVNGQHTLKKMRDLLESGPFPIVVEYRRVSEPQALANQDALADDADGNALLKKLRAEPAKIPEEQTSLGSSQPVPSGDEKDALVGLLYEHHFGGTVYNGSILQRSGDSYMIQDIGSDPQWVSKEQAQRLVSGQLRLQHMHIKNRKTGATECVLPANLPSMAAASLSASAAAPATPSAAQKPASSSRKSFNLVVPSTTSGSVPPAQPQALSKLTTKLKRKPLSVFDEESEVEMTKFSWQEWKRSKTLSSGKAM